MSNSKNKRVFIYTRCSTEKQNVESQVHALKKYCADNNIDNYEMFTDEGISGAKLSRPGLNRMMAAVENNEASMVIVFSFSRFARSTTHLLSALQKFKEKNVEFISLTENINTNSPMGLALFSILAALSQMEREIIAQRVKAGLANARAKGKIIGRKKERNSELIRALLRKNLTYRMISSISGASHGSIYAEKKLLQKEEEEAKKKKLELEKMKEAPPSLPPLPVAT